jgi:hypothetical protein
VAPEVIDVVVAVSYPRYFDVGADAQVSQNDLRELDPYAGSTLGRGWGYGRRGMFWNPMYRGYGSYYGDYFGYGGYYGGGLYGYPGIYRPTIVVVEPRDTEPAPRGRLVNGRGYTRPGSRPSSSEGGASRSSGGSSSEPPSSGGSSSGSSTGRTARPRNP